MNALRALVAGGALDGELGAVVWLLAVHGVPVVAVGPRPEPAEQLRSAIAAAVRSEQPARDSVPGGSFIGRSLAEILSRTGSHGMASAGNTLADEARDLGVVLVMDDSGSVAAAHYVRPVERDAAGHIQRRPPAVLAARGSSDGSLDHYWWAFTDELATRCAIDRATFETDLESRIRRLTEPETVPGRPDARH